MFACSEHFSQFLNVWYIETFKKNDIINRNDFPVLVEQYLFHIDNIGRILPTDPIGSVLALMFVPWATHMFIGFAGYNISRKEPAVLRENLGNINKILFFMFLLFYAENFIVSNEFFAGLLISPVITWMLILIFSNSVYAFFGFGGVLITFFSSLILKMLSNSGFFQINLFSQIISSIHPRIVESTEPLNYLPSCLIGTLFGAYVNQYKKDKPFSNRTKLFFGALTIFFLWQSRHLFRHDPSDIFSFDELLITNNFGILFVISIIVTSLTILHQLEKQKPYAWLRPLEYVGIHSLGIYLIHRILFSSVLAPIRFHLGSYFKLPMTNNVFEIMLIYFPCTVFCYWLLIRFGFFGPLFVKQNEKM
jgi:hypothetical protein